MGVKIMRKIRVAAQTLGLLALTGLSLNAANGGVITLTNFKVLYPTDECFQVVAAGVAKGETSIGSYGLGSFEEMAQEDVPPGFVLAANGYAYPEKMDTWCGDLDNGKFDQDPRTGSYARTFSTKGWKPGKYDFSFCAHNRPAEGPYILDRRLFSVYINQAGKIGTSPSLVAKNIIIYKQDGAYACFPSLLQTADGILVTSFDARIKRSHIDTTGEAITMCSRDNGLTWTKTTKSFLNPKLRTKNGQLVSISVKGWQYVADSERPRLELEDRSIMDVRPGTIAYQSTDCWVRTSSDNGNTWQTKTVSGPEYIRAFAGFADAASFLVTSKGTILYSLYGLRHGGEFRDEVFFIRSTDNGKTFRVVPMLPNGLGKGGVGFNETAILETKDGKILAMMRSVSEDYLWQSFSADDGLTWSAPEKTKMWGYPAHLLNLPDGKILCTRGYRKMPMGIRACVSRDNGRTWDIASEYILRSDGQHEGSDLGYPISALLSDGSIFTIYYFNGEDNITHIAATIWRL